DEIGQGEEHMTITNDVVARDLAALAAESAYDPRPGSPFVYREEFKDYEVGSELSENMQALRDIGTDVLAHTNDPDPSAAYVSAVAHAKIDELERGTNIGREDAGLLRDALRELEESARRAVARAWLTERASIPVPLP